MMPAGGPAAGRLGGLIAPLVVVAAAAVTLAFDPLSPAHRRAVAFAALACLAGTIGAWVAGCWPVTTPAARVTASLGAIGLRIFPALLALGWLQTEGQDLQAASAGEMLVGFYLLALAADLIRTIMGASRTARRPGDDESI
jgi:hypothetical protein